ncbi:MAG: outer membrane porin, OprD family [Gammaproteobacteria bacterium]|nr:outer membrane porin, OprD family [Gammaproteobacteria bacterium]
MLDRYYAWPQITLMLATLLPSSVIIAGDIDHTHQNNCKSYARSAYIHTNTENNPSEKAVAVGGYLGCDLALTPMAEINLGLFTSINPHNIDDDQLHSDFFDSNGNSYLLLGQFALNLTFDSIDVQLGRQRFDSPHMDSDDLRMVPNLFEAYQFNYNFSEDTHFGFAYLTKMAGWENGGDQSKFVDLGQAYGGQGDGAYALWGLHNIDKLALQLWAYKIDDIANIIYVDAVYADNLTDEVSYELAVQYDRGRDSGGSLIGQINADTFGIHGSFAYRKYSIFAAYNKNNGSSGAVTSLGTGPFFTSMEDQTLDAITGGDAQAFVVGFEYQIAETITAGVATGNFSAPNKSDYDVDEIDLYMTYRWNEAFDFEAIYASIDDHNGLNDTHQLRLVANYYFADF